MQIDKYYDWSRRAALSPGDGCAYDRWPEEWKTRSFAVHPGGILVFLPPSRITESDEYSRGDSYGVGSMLDHPFQQVRFETTLELLNKAGLGDSTSARVLDVGCGQGHITAWVCQAFPRAEMSGLDCSLTTVRSAAEQYPGIDFIVADACAAPYREAYFDFVVCNNIWEHVPDPLGLLASVRRVLKPGGHLLLSTSSRYDLWNLLGVLRGRPVVLASKHHVTEYTVGQVLEQLRFGGFEVEDVYARPVRQRPRSLREFVVLRIIGPVLRTILAAVGSHHRLESTVFYLARKLAGP